MVELRVARPEALTARARIVPDGAGEPASSLPNNLESTHGYNQRFGLGWADHATGRRIPQDGCYSYRDFIRMGLRLAP